MSIFPSKDRSNNDQPPVPVSFDTLVKNSGMKKSFVANQLGIDSATFWKWRKDVSLINVKTIVTLSKLFHKEEEYIFECIMYTIRNPEATVIENEE
ncbi:hypothetical protein QNI19_31875 [Cytophagaceae bacterium DM2B3-1]|uniref:Homeodomain phBC6A51-type domain-containing protein n=1 Tax=Xanthocytophaga flava TaxID=3048013 RepID=A0ABT7CUY2_9BACT|nr:hypothetical protein [Xanthocytophaga flavus]MDJ1497581.1 hypothetical protein [Xanthocytophaga flavus]